MPRAAARSIIWQEPRAYFDSLEEAQQYVLKHKDTPVSQKWPEASTDQRLLVCHDFKGGYTESESERGYSLEHWESVDVFVYFSHHRVTLPPSQWIRAAHENDTPILGTLIFEWDEALGDISILLGRSRRVYVSTRFADILIELALQRNIQGYLINVEAPLNLSRTEGAGGKFEAIMNAERLRKWVDYLRRRGRDRTGGRQWHVVWYDSVVHPHGCIAYQNALTPANAPFFDVATSVFTNYSWTSQKLTDDRKRALLTGSKATSSALGRSQSDVFFGVDVFGRGSVGGLETPAALELLRSQGSFSTALFAPGWTWEHEDRPWKDWWEVDTSFWKGVSKYHLKQCSYTAFATNFCKGSGSAWTIMPLARIKPNILSATVIAAGCVQLMYMDPDKPETATIIDNAVTQTFGDWTCMTAPIRTAAEVFVGVVLEGDAHIGYVQVAPENNSVHDATWDPSNGHLTWPDFCPWAHAYEIFAVGDKTTWLGTTLERTSTRIAPPQDTLVLEVRPVGCDDVAFVAIA
ncbi:mannosyl-glycoprotein endo-beta-N-acetylglucosaminidase [Malassezia cuniculi]|uniref:Mannosyl-glycoprotein endo-beta-N-acetylglucosaminidase n=1 Tax=Malassezia cuniculi TaxID=948313 RepID=A0AAF0J731_9BASI|nr:mannosyl-glycoprotein endo-beta-N-acetylglucosaminidase [Malassezia cuniculi]